MTAPDAPDAREPSDAVPGRPVETPLPPERAPFDLRGNLVVVAALVAASALLGVAMGAMWHWLAPRVPLYADTAAVYLKDPEGEQAIGADGTFALIGLGFGLVAGVLAYWRTRTRGGGVAVALGLTLGGLLGAYVAKLVGIALGPSTDVVALAKSVPTGQLFYGPLKLTAAGVLTAWPIAALVALMGLTALFTPKPEPLPLQWSAPTGTSPHTSAQTAQTPAQRGPEAP